MNEEEKKAIEFFEKLFKKKIPPYWYDNTIYNIEEKIKIILNLIEKQQKEIGKEKEKNKELTEYLITQNYEINRLNLAKIRLEMSQLPDTAEGYKYLKNEYKMRLSRMNLEDYKRNYISKDKIKEKMQQDIYTNEHTILGGRRNGKTLEYGIRLGRIQVCEELLEERK